MAADTVPTAARRAPLSRESAPLAAVDLGSNSFHMVVARHSGGTLQIQDRLREPVRLGAALDAQARLPESAWGPALECLARFGERLRGLPPSAVRAVGTNTLRKARNADAFLAVAAQALGHEIEVIAGIEEARLIYLGVAQYGADDGHPRLVVDIGGGSTELIIGRGSEPTLMESLHMGCVSQTAAHFSDGRIGEGRLKAAVLAALVEFEPVVARFEAAGWTRALGASGTLQAVRDAIAALVPGQEFIDAAGLARLRAAVLEAGRADRLGRLAVKPDRMPVFAGGLSVVLALFEAFGLQRLEVSDGALREGVLYDLVGRIQRRDVRERTVAELMRRYHVDRPHAQRVAETAAALLAQAADAWQLDDPLYAQFLRWSALLHEIGLDVAHAEYHKHGAYILEHADLPGYSRQEQRMLAVLVRAHRRKFPLAEYARLVPVQRPAFEHLGVLLRLAVVLHRSRHGGGPVPQLACAGGHVTLRFPDGWLAGHPLTRADLEQEAAFLAAAGYTLEV